MKTRSRKLFIAALAWMAAWGLAGCSNESENSLDENQEVKINFTVADKGRFDETVSKAVKTGWANGDQIRVFFMPTGSSYIYTGNSTAGTLLLEYNGSTWSESGLTESDIANMGSNGVFTAVHYRGTIGIGETYLGNLELYDATNKYKGGELLVHSAGTYTISGGAVNLGTISMKLQDNLALCQVSIPKSKVSGLDAGWKLAVLNKKTPAGKLTSFSDYDSDNDGIQTIYFRYIYDCLATSSTYFATGVENGEDVSFVFRASTSDESDTDTYGDYVFYLTNADGTKVYTLRLNRGTYSSGKYEKQLEGGKAYKLTGDWTEQN